MPFESVLRKTRFCFHHREGALPAIAIDHPQFSASVLVQGAQLVRFNPKGGPNWLWLSEREPFLPGKAVRGGIPICWPWFGDPDRNPERVRQHINSSEAHGLARQIDWQLEQIDESDEAVTLSLSLDSAQFEAGSWLGQAQVSVQFRFSGQALDVSLKSCNTGAEPVHISQALHSYFPTAEIQRTEILGLDGERYIDALDHWHEKRQLGPILFEGETDRIYDASAPMDLKVPDAVLHLRQQGAAKAVVWNPWDDKAGRLSHFAADAWQRMFCVETANVLDDAVCLEAGISHTMSFRLARS